MINVVTNRILFVRYYLSFRDTSQPRHSTFVERRVCYIVQNMLFSESILVATQYLSGEVGLDLNMAAWQNIWFQF